MSTIYGTKNKDSLYGTAGNDLIYAYESDDYIDGDDGNDTLYGGAGDDEIIGGAGANSLYGGDGNDYLWAKDDANLFDGGAGIDSIYGGAGNDTVTAGAGNDEIFADAGNDVVNGDDGNDYLDGDDGHDDLRGGAGDDELSGGWGSNTLSGGDGNDSLWADDDASVFDGGAGQDTLSGGAGDDTMHGGSGNDQIDGKDGNNQLFGDDGNDDINGGQDDDAIDGGSGNDTLYGSDGDDTLNGGAGADSMTGGSGSDTYVVDNLNDHIDDSFTASTTVQINVDNYLTPYRSTEVYQSADTLHLAYFVQSIATNNVWFNFGEGGNIKYSFATTTTDGIGTFEKYTDAQKKLVKDVLAEYAKYLNVTFTEVTGTDLSAVKLMFYKDADLDRSHASYPSADQPSHIVLASVNANRPATVMHELGHALGLKHTADNDNDDPDAGPWLVAAEDNVVNTIMSYNGEADVSSYAPKPYDIAALQYLYGVNSAARSGNDTYTQNTRFIWDGSGSDTINLASATAAVTLDMRGGAWSWVKAKAASILANGQFFINSGTLIENAQGSAFGDAIRGNAAHNRIDGGAGADSLRGAEGNDTLIGGTGADSLTGGDGSDTYDVDNASDKVVETNASASTGGTDLVLSSLGSYTLGSNVENGQINTSSAANLTGNGLSNVLYAGAGNNVLNGDAGTDTVSYSYASAAVTASLALTTAQATGGSASDTLLNIENLSGSKFNDKLTGSAAHNKLDGAAGDDVLDGGLGNDTLIGGAGKDSLTGGAGNDVFDFNALPELGLGSTRDAISNFVVGQDKIDLSTIDTNTALAGDQAFSLVTSFTATAGQVRYAGGIVYLNTDTDTAAEYEIQLTGTIPASLTAANFVL